MRRVRGIACGLSVLIALSVIAAGALAGNPGRAASTITARVDDRTVHFSPGLHAGFVRLHFVSTGAMPESLHFFQLHRGVTFRQFDKEDLGAHGNPFKLATLIGGNGQLEPGRSMDIWLRIAKGRLAIDAIPAGPGNGFHLDVTVRTDGASAARPKALGTLAAVAGDRYQLPHGFGRPGIWEFVNRDNEPHEASIARLDPGRTVADVVSWAKNGRHGPPPLASADGGFGPLGAHSRGWFTIGHLAPGNYAVICFIPGPDGVPHVAMGMAAGFNVR